MAKKSPYYSDWIDSHYSHYVGTKINNFTVGEIIKYLQHTNFAFINFFVVLVAYNISFSLSKNF